MVLVFRSLRIAFCVGFFLMLVSDGFSAQIDIPGMYVTIQEGVDAAGNGDTIVVAAGTYVENIRVDKSLTIRSENGAMQTFVQGQHPGHHVFSVFADQVTIQGFTISGALESDAAGIIINPGYGQCILRDNQVGMLDSANLNGIFLVDSHGNYIEGNTVNNNTGNGIIISRGTGNILKSNTIAQNGTCGIAITMGVGNRFIANTIKDHNNSYGVLLHVSSDNLFSENEFSENYSDIRMRYNSNNNNIINNVCENSDYHAIQLDHDSTGNKISGNECTNTASYGSGIHLRDVGANIVYGNTISGYSNGIGFQGATDCSVYSNVCNENRFSGVEVNFDSQRNKIYGNQCNDNEKFGINVLSSSLNQVRFNTCNDNQNAGLSLVSSQENIFSRNSATGNAYGIQVESSMNNRVFLNAFAGNDASVFSQDSQTRWQDEQPLTYSFQGTIYTSILGNFYSDHDLTDSDKNGVTDSSKNQPDIDLDDDYPLAMNHALFLTASSDIDFDGDVDGQDAARFITALVAETMTADLNQDTVFDQLDIEAFAVVFGK